MEQSSSRQINIAKMIGGGYGDIWNFKGRYLAIKGGRGSKKSCNTSIRIPYNMMKYYHKYGLKPNCLVIRKHYNTNKESTFAQLRWALNYLGVADLWKVRFSPLELEYRPSGQKIIFRGIDDPDSITSITSADGYLCWVWWEEAYQVTSEDAFNKVDMSIRGDMPKPLYKQHILTFNPWSDRTWIKRRFFDLENMPDKVKRNILATTTTYKCNEFLGEDDIAIFEDMRKRNPRRYNIEGLGNWGIATGQVYENWKEEEFDWVSILNAKDSKGKNLFTPKFGLDFGYSIDPTAFIALLASTKLRKIYIFDEFYAPRMNNRQIFEKIQYKGFHNQLIKCDHDPRTINELNILGLHRAKEAKKGTIESGIQRLQDYDIIVHPKCKNTKMELENYVWATDTKTDDILNRPVDEYNHLMDAMRYACDDINRGTFRWN